MGGKPTTIKDEAHFREVKRVEFYKRYKDPPKQLKASLDDFTRMSTLGAGAYGLVILCKHKETKKYHAMKILEKKKIVKYRQHEHAMNEKKILESIDCPFIVSLNYKFQDNANLFLVLEVVNGGEMFSHLRTKRHFSETLAQFYAAQVVLALDYLHNLDVLYRDLKPENILICGDGYIKLTDLGFAKIVSSRTYTMCGTPDYIAPEIIKNKGYGKPVDWWALGILMYEMNAGWPPFMTALQDEIDPQQQTMKLYENIVEGKIKYPRRFSPELKDLIKNLVQVDLTKRYGNLKKGVNDIREHKWFQRINWRALYEKKLTAPFKPKIKGPDDVSNFTDSGPEEEIASLTEDKYKDLFKDF